MNHKDFTFWITLTQLFIICSKCSTLVMSQQQTFRDLFCMSNFFWNYFWSYFWIMLDSYVCPFIIFQHNTCKIFQRIPFKVWIQVLLNFKSTLQEVHRGPTAAAVVNGAVFADASQPFGSSGPGGEKRLSSGNGPAPPGTSAFSSKPAN